MIDPQVLPIVSNWGPGALLAFAVFLIVTGRLVPRSVMDQQIRLRDEIIEKLQQSLDRRDGVVPAQLEAARVVEKLMTDLKAQTDTGVKDDQAS